MADVEDGDEPCALSSHSGGAGSKSGGDKMFSLKKWNAVAMWSWDVECDTCAICRVQMPVLDVKLKTNKRIVLEDSCTVRSCAGTGATTSFTDSRAVVGLPYAQTFLYSGLGRM
ncbi:RING-box protein 2 isoform X3 [Pipistrellus kuhlii]|uniref:RING-box protein 2 isoform X3 n=1 Tax=Pipistrellus kuhlii TaxID=59472 RepID=UPI00174F78D8|nr:RING-box protein 2 isoform X3 [Pipistrellus kuhlii]